MLISFVILLTAVIAEFPTLGLPDAVQKVASHVKRDASLAESGVNSDSSSGWYEHEDSITATKAVEVHARKRDAKVETDVGALAKRQSRSKKSVVSPDTSKFYQPQYALPVAVSENTEDFIQKTEAELANNQPQIQTSYKRSPDDYSNSGKKDTSLRTTQPVEKGSNLNVKRQLSPEASLILHNIRMYQPFYALEPSESEDAETFEDNSVAEISGDQPPSQNHLEKRDMAIKSERPLQSVDESHDERETRSESDLLQHELGAYQVPSDLQPTDAKSMVAYNQIPDAELSETNMNSIEGSQTPIQYSSNIIPSKFDFTNQGVKRNVRQPSREKKALSGSRRQLPGDAMPVFLADYYQQQRCDKHKSGGCKEGKCGGGKCGGTYCNKREANLPTYNSLHTGTNKGLTPRQASKRNAKLPPNEMLDFELSYAQQNLEDAAMSAPKRVVRRQANLRYLSDNLLKPEKYSKLVRREATGKYFPIEMLKFELDYTQNKLKQKARHPNFKRETKSNPLYDLSKHADKVRLVQKRSSSSAKREVKQFPIEMLKFELDYKKRNIKKKREQAPAEFDTIDQDTMLNQPFDALQSTESENVVPFQQSPESDTSNVQQPLHTNFKRSSNENIYKQQRDAIKVSGESMKRSTRSYANIQLSPESSMAGHDTKFYEPLNALQHSESENVVTFEQNPESDISNVQQSLETTLKRNYNENGHAQKRCAIQTSGQPMERSTGSHGNTQLNPESTMADLDTDLVLPFNELQQTESENAVALEQNPDSDSANVQQSFQTTIKRSSDENGYNTKRYALDVSSQPMERSTSAFRKIRLSPEASMVDHYIKIYQPFYALQPTRAGNSVAFAQNSESDSSNAQETLQTKFKRSSNANGHNQKRDVVKMTAQLKERSASSRRKVRNAEANMLDHEIKMDQPLNYLQPTELESAEPLQENQEAELSSGQPLIESSFERSPDVQNRAAKRNTIMTSAHPEASASGQYEKRESSLESELVNRDIKLFQPYYCLPPIESGNAETLVDNLEDLSIARPSLEPSFKRSLNGKTRSRKSYKVMRSAYPKQRSFPLYEKRELSPESEMISRNIKLRQPSYTLPTMQLLNTETIQDNPEADASVAQPSLQSSFKRSLNEKNLVTKRAYTLPLMQSVNTETIENNPEADDSVAQPSLQSSFKRSLNEKNLVTKRAYTLPLMQSVNTETIENNPETYDSVAPSSLQSSFKRSLNEKNLVTKRAYTLPLMQSVNTETIENNPEADDSVAPPSLQSSLKRSLNEKNLAMKSDTAMRYAQPSKRGSPYEKRESTAESELVDRDIKLYQPFYALPQIASENAGTLEHDEDVVDSADNQPHLQYSVKRSSNNNGPSRKRDTSMLSTSPEGSAVNLYGQRRLRLY